MPMSFKIDQENRPPDLWRLVEDPPLPGQINMDRDLAILEAVAAGDAPPTLRIYRWSPPALSLGYFQAAEAVADTRACRRLGIDLVRRPTGGRAVLHHRELTYSVALPAGHPHLSRDILESYRFINLAIVEAFKTLGIDASLSGAAERGGGPAPGSCFDTASAYEVRVRGKKVAGSAQLRRGGALLQHGAILLELPLALYRQVLRPPAAEGAASYLELLGREAAGLHDLGYPVAVEALSAALVKGFRRVLSVTFPQ